MSGHRGMTGEEIVELLKELEDKTLIVEGKRDKKALKSLGLKNIITIEGKPLYKVVEIVSARKEVVILTDFDKKGREIGKRLRHLLQKHKKHVNSKLRGKMMSLGKTQIEDLANLNSQMNLKEVDAHVKAGTKFNKISDKGTDKCKGGNRKT